MSNISILDSTLRDGAQGVDISFSVNDKLAIAQALDDYGVSYIEAGNPGSNPKDMDFFKLASALSFKNSILTAFGSTRRKEQSPESDPNLSALLSAGTPAVALFGKSWDLHATEILGVSLDENLTLIDDSIRYFKSRGKHIIFDAEHFFDGYYNNPEYALKVITSAAEAGADVICLCDTNGGVLPFDLYNTVTAVKNVLTGITLGIHLHNDIGCAAANSILAVDGGVTHVQGTFIGIGERCGNADLSTILPTLLLKSGRNPAGDISKLSVTAKKIAEISNILLPENKPYIGEHAFSHKGGMHIDGVLKNNASFEHINPESVGNKRRFLISEVSGRGGVLEKVNSFAPNLQKGDPQLADILRKVKSMEFDGYQFEAADASFEITARKVLGMFSPHFRIVFYKTIGDFPAPENELPSTATVKVEVNGETETTAAQGRGPVNALDGALRKALIRFYPSVGEMKLTDYKVRVIDQKTGTAAKVRVLIESTDNSGMSWVTIGVSNDIIQASLIALIDSIEYQLRTI